MTRFTAELYVGLSNHIIGDNYSRNTYISITLFKCSNLRCSAISYAKNASFTLSYCTRGRVYCRSRDSISTNEATAFLMMRQQYRFLSSFIHVTAYQSSPSLAADGGWETAHETDGSLRGMCRLETQQQHHSNSSVQLTGLTSVRRRSL